MTDTNTATTAEAFNKTKVEKAVKDIERQMETTHADVESRSVKRALARQIAAKQLYPALSDDEINKNLVDSFYATAKFQASWKPHFDKYAPTLGAAMQGALATPSPRTRKVKDPAEITAQANTSVTPNTVLGVDPNAKD